MIIVCIESLHEQPEALTIYGTQICFEEILVLNGLSAFEELLNSLRWNVILFEWRRTLYSKECTLKEKLRNNCYKTVLLYLTSS